MIVICCVGVCAVLLCATETAVFGSAQAIAIGGVGGGVGVVLV